MVLEGFVSVNVSGRRTGESNTPPYLCASIHYCSLCGYMAIINACHFIPSVQILSTMFFKFPTFYIYDVSCQVTYLETLLYIFAFGCFAA